MVNEMKTIPIKKEKDFEAIKEAFDGIDCDYDKWVGKWDSYEYEFHNGTRVILRDFDDDNFEMDVL